MHPSILHLLSSASPSVLSEFRFCRFPIWRETALTDKRANSLTAIFRGSPLRRKREEKCSLCVGSRRKISVVSWLHMKKMKRESGDDPLRAAKLAEPGLIGNTENSVGSSAKDWPRATVCRAESPLAWKEMIRRDKTGI